MNYQILLTSVALFIGGSLAGWLLAPSDMDSQSRKIPVASKSSRLLTDSPRYGPGISGNARMKLIRDSQSESERIKLAIALARSLPLNEAGRWLNEGLFSQREGFALTVFTRTLERRWQAADPDGYSFWQLEGGKEVSTNAMSRLAESDPDLLLNKIRLIRNPEAQTRAMANLAKARPDLAWQELTDKDAAAWKQSTTLKVFFRELAQADLAALQAGIEKLPASLRDEAQDAIYGELLIRDFSGTVAQLEKFPDGLETFVRLYGRDAAKREEFFRSFTRLPEGWQNRVENDPDLLTGGMKPGEMLSTDWESFGLSGKAAGKIKGDALFDEIRGQKAEAIALFQQADLGEAGRRHLLDMLTWNKGGDIIEELMPVLEPADQEYITEKLSASWVAKNAEPGPRWKFQTPAEISKKLAEQENRSFEDFSKVRLTWKDDQWEQFQAGYAALAGDERHRVTAVLAHSPNQEAQAAALSELLNSPEAQRAVDWDESEVAFLTSNLAVDLLKQDVDRATAWVSGLAEGDSRSWAMKNLAANWRNYDPQAAESWVDSLPASEREDVREFLKNPRP